MSKKDTEGLSNWSSVQVNTEPLSDQKISDLTSEARQDSVVAKSDKSRAPYLWLLVLLPIFAIGYIAFTLFNGSSDNEDPVVASDSAELDDDKSEVVASPSLEDPIEYETAVLSTETGDRRDPSRPKMLVASFTADRKLIVRGNVPTETFYKNITAQFQGVATASGYELVNEWIINPDAGLPDSIIGNYEQTAIFESGSAVLDEDQIINLAPSYATLAQFDVVSASIIGHTDSTGSTESNELLSLKRAQAVRDFFLSPQAPDIFIPAQVREQRCLTPEELTINADQITIVAAGESEATGSKNDSDRRVEVRYENNLKLEALLEENPPFMQPRTC